MPRRAEAAPGVLAVVTYRNAGPLSVGKFYVQRMLAAPGVEHYHQPVPIVVAETFDGGQEMADHVGAGYSVGTCTCRNSHLLPL
jgi:xanthine dehydrogenase YagR molybdenum-binding subunit